MSLILGKNPSNEVQPVALDSNNNVKVNIAASAATLAADVTIVADSVGLATEATLAGVATEFTLQTLATEATLAGVATELTLQNVATEATLLGVATETTAGLILVDTTAMNGKMTQGYDAQIAAGGNGLFQNLMYGRDASGNLDAVKVNANGNLQVGLHDFDDVKGQATMANSFPVVVASDQSSIPVTVAGGTTVNVNQSIAGLSLGTANSTAVDMDGYSQLTIFGTSTNTSDQIIVQVSHDNSTWVEHTQYYINFAFSGGAYAINIENTGARYWRISQTDTQAAAFTLVVNSSKK